MTDSRRALAAWRHFDATGAVVATEILRKPNGRPQGFFWGDDDGGWSYGTHFEWGWKGWFATIALSSKNDWRNLSVDNATEHHAGFLRALREMVRQYPELQDWWVSFDGPMLPVSKLLGAHPTSFNWSAAVFYHGTSSSAWERIRHEGLRPRAETNVMPAYGNTSSAALGRPEAVYLTTQLTMAQFAARDAARATQSSSVVLEVRGLNADLVQAVEDSRETDPLRSLGRLGSIAYVGRIPASHVRLHATFTDGCWQHA